MDEKEKLMAKKEASILAKLAKDAVNACVKSAAILIEKINRAETLTGKTTPSEETKESKYAMIVAKDAQMRRREYETKFREKLDRAEKILKQAIDASANAKNECMNQIRKSERKLHNTVATIWLYLPM